MQASYSKSCPSAAILLVGSERPHRLFPHLELHARRCVGGWVWVGVCGVVWCGEMCVWGGVGDDALIPRSWSSVLALIGGVNWSMGEHTAFMAIAEAARDAGSNNNESAGASVETN